MSTDRDHRVDDPPLDDEPVDDQHSAARRTAQMLGVGHSLVFVSFLVVSRSVAAIAPADTGSAGRFSGATVELTDDDAGTALFDARDLLPGDSRRACISVRYEGSVAPADVTLAVRASGDLARSLDLRVRRGTGGGSGGCDGFRSEREIYDGPMAGDRRLAGLEAMRAERSPEKATFEFEVTLRPDAEASASGQAASVEFVWTADL